MNHPGSGTAQGIAAAVPRLIATGYRFIRLSDEIRWRSCREHRATIIIRAAGWLRSAPGLLTRRNRAVGSGSGSGSGFSMRVR
jgi:hypothetical protein